MFEAFLNHDEDELDIQDYEDQWSQYRFSIIKEVLDKIEGDTISDKNRMRYYKLSEQIFKALQERLEGKK